MRGSLRALVALVLVAVPAAAQVIVAPAVASPTQTRAGTQGAGGSVSQPSTLAALVAELDRNNPAIKAARREVDVRLAREAPAGAPPDPTFSFGYRRRRRLQGEVAAVKGTIVDVSPRGPWRSRRRSAARSRQIAGSRLSCRHTWLARPSAPSPSRCSTSTEVHVSADESERGTACAIPRRDGLMNGRHMYGLERTTFDDRNRRLHPSDDARLRRHDGGWRLRNGSAAPTQTPGEYTG